jgi:2-polyprenyl-3-methyl-5-hydroxy-6-metoxy-1,4-benzoquinol methylase
MIACSHPDTSAEPLFPARDYITGDQFTITRCSSCGLIRTLPIPSDISRYYPSGYYGGDRRYNRLLEVLLGKLYSRRAAAIERRSGVTGGRVLDVGCGRGWLLDAFRRRGWTATGTELTEESARYAREALHLDVLVGDRAVHALPEATYDVVILWHVLEHIAEPASLVADVARVLRPGGTLLVAVPNAGSAEARWGRDRWFHLDVPRHLVHFTPATLRSTLHGAGLLTVHEEYLSPEYDTFSTVQTILNRAGIRQNALYNLVRSRGARVLSGDISMRDLALTLVLVPWAASFAAVWAPLAAAVHRGATITAYARKPPYTSSPPTP